jgi:phospholipase C
VSQILDALTANPEVWAKTAMFLTYDENDGFFDHVPPPTVPASRKHGLSTVDTVHEIFPGTQEHPRGPYGMGPRVPMIVISPWSKGGWVNSELFDHTSIIRFIERRFAAHGPALRESNITPWRRAVAGDLTSAFNFGAPDDARVVLPSTLEFKPPDRDKHPDYRPAPPATQALPRQEAGLRPARGLPYELHVRGEMDFSRKAVTLQFKNSGKAAAVFHVRTVKTLSGPWTYTVGAGAELADEFEAPDIGQDVWELMVHGPNGFLRAFKGSFDAGSFDAGDRANLEVRSAYDIERVEITLSLRNSSLTPVRVRITDAYAKHATALDLARGDTLERNWPLDSTFGWYDLTLTVDSDAAFERRLAGHVETGKDSMTDPAIGGPAA